VVTATTARSIVKPTTVDYRADDLAEVIDAALRRHLAAGVTTMRDLGDRQWSVLERRDRPNDGTADVTSPTILASGPPITSIRGHCWQMGGEAQDAATLRAAIRERAEHRVDVVKIMASGGVTTAGTDLLACQFSRDDVRLTTCWSPSPSAASQSAPPSAQRRMRFRPRLSWPSSSVSI
jgi:hypothetical protein